MKTEQIKWTSDQGWFPPQDATLGQQAQLVLAFGSRQALSESARYDELKSKYPNAHIVLNSTSGEIIDTQVVDDTIVATAVHLERTEIRVAQVDVSGPEESKQAGVELAEKLQGENLANVFVISDGQKVNGSELVSGLNGIISPDVPITGGLAGDGADFQKTLVGVDAPPSEGKVLAVGFYGTKLRVGHGSKGGWDSFGPERKITKATDNVLYELDGQPALELYKKYLGEHASGLPGTGLLFPLSIKVDGGPPLVRTILAVDEAENSMTFAGDMPIDSNAQLMRANFDRLIDGASTAASDSFSAIDEFEPELALLVSCVGRKLVLGQRIEEEVEGIREVLGDKPTITGFYSYGEISPFNPSAKCQLHNQTMTITTLAEVE